MNDTSIRPALGASIRIHSQRDFWSGLIFIVVGLAFAVGALSYSFGSSARPGPGYFPFGLGILLALLGAFTLFEALTIHTEDGEPVGAIAWKPLLLILAAVGVFGAALPHVGMVIALPTLIVIASLASDEFSWTATVLNSIVLTIGSWIVFIWGLNLTIPLWPGFIAA